MVTMQFFSLFTVPLSFADSAACLAPRYMVVCLDNGCIKVCIKEGFSFCVRGYLGSYAHSDFKANDFQRINADKWQLAKDVSSRSSFFIMVDADGVCTLMFSVLGCSDLRPLQCLFFSTLSQSTVQIWVHMTFAIKWKVVTAATPG